MVAITPFNSLLFLFSQKNPRCFVLASTCAVSPAPASTGRQQAWGPGVSPRCYIGVRGDDKETNKGARWNKENQMTFLVSMRLERGLPKSSRT